MKITKSIIEAVTKAGYDALYSECTEPAGSNAFGEVKSSLSIFLDMLQEGVTLLDVNHQMEGQNLQYCGYNAAYDKLFEMINV